MFFKLTLRYKDTIECAEEPLMKTTKRRRNNVNCRELHNDAIADGVLGKDQENF